MHGQLPHNGGRVLNPLLMSLTHHCLRQGKHVTLEENMRLKRLHANGQQAWRSGDAIFWRAHGRHSCCTQQRCAFATRAPHLSIRAILVVQMSLWSITAEWHMGAIPAACSHAALSSSRAPHLKHARHLGHLGVCVFWAITAL